MREELLPGHRVAVFRREELRDAERRAARNDRHLVDRVVAGGELTDQRVPGLVPGRDASFFLAHHHAPPFRAHEDLVLRELEVDHRDGFLVLTGGE